MYFHKNILSSETRKFYIETRKDSIILLIFNPHKPVAQKTADEVVFRRFQGEGVEFFFKSDLTDPPLVNNLKASPKHTL